MQLIAKVYLAVNILNSLLQGFLYLLLIFIIVQGKISYIYREQNHPKLTSIPDDIPDEVYNVDFKHNNLGKIPSNSFRSLKKIKDLRLFHNNISVI